MDINNYVPILRTKQGEFKALFNLTQELKKQITPLFEIRPMGKTEKKTIDAYLAKACKNILGFWPIEELCLIDIYGIPHSMKVESASSPLNLILNNLKKGGLNFIPTIGLDREEGYINEVKLFLDENEAAELCIRLTREDLGLPQKTKDDLESLLKKMNLKKERSHLLVDLRFIHEDTVDVHVDSIAALTGEIDITSWKSLIVAGSSIPEDVSGMKAGTANVIRRKEYDLWVALNESVGLIGRAPQYADYTIIHPDKKDASGVTSEKINTKIRYTTDTGWLILKGTKHNNRDTKVKEFQKMALQISNDQNFQGEGFSWGDRNIFQCAQKNTEPCGWGKWVEIDINHHLTFVAHQIASSSVFA